MNVDVETFVQLCDSELGKWVMKEEHEYVYNEVRYYGKILDVGCDLSLFEQIHLNIICLDTCEEILEEARKKSDKTFIQGNVEELASYETYIRIEVILQAKPATSRP